ncbi:MAG: hypothetical protein M4579_002945 [Chaenotheca gracillima]|nr:MAG: hypothetical protein M4579_002945 [Chaenotheca gracillima]
MTVLGILFYVLLNWSYTTAVFTDPGSPLELKSGYSHLPTLEPRSSAVFTVKSTGDARFCKKCQAKKPDRAHHCSTCQRCVLKMDHHCPWLATCLGLHNYKPFVLFLIYTTLFCWVDFAISGTWMWGEVLVDAQYDDSIMPVNYVLLTVLSGIIGLVLTGFTGWHLMLGLRNQTTIECLEKTRYLSPLRRTFEDGNRRLGVANSSNGPSYGQQFLEIHANTVPGVTRAEEGEERPSPQSNQTNFTQQGAEGWNQTQRSYNDYERSRQRERYEEYLDEKDSDSLPHAFDLGWKRNFVHLFGPKPLYWMLPICNTTGDGWNWEASQKWIQAREEIKLDRERQWRQQNERYDPYAQRPYNPETDGSSVQSPSRNYVPQPARSAPRRSPSGRRSPYKADQILGRTPDQFVDDPTHPDFDAYGPNGVSMRNLRGRPSSGDDDEDMYELSSDEEEVDQRLLPPRPIRSGTNAVGSNGVSPARRTDKGSTKSS